MTSDYWGVNTFVVSLKKIVEMFPEEWAHFSFATNLEPEKVLEDIANGGAHDNPIAPEAMEALDDLMEAYRKKFGLTIDLIYHDRFSAYDTHDGLLFEVYGVVTYTDAGLWAFRRNALEEASWVVWG